jgi:hypothetical protein
MNQELVKDTIPRVHHVRYFRAVLEGVASGGTFDELRAALRRVAREIGSRQTASPVEDAYTLWSPTADALSELMRLELISHRTLPSKRVAVDQHRETKYELTPQGEDMIREVGGNDSAFREAITPYLLKKHPYFFALCQALSQGALLIPEYTEGELSRFRQKGSWIVALAEDAAARMSTSMKGASTNGARVTEHVRAWLSRRFPIGATPSNKEVLDAVLDALVVAALEARSLRFDAITFNILAAWGRQLFITDESRYVHPFTGRVMWLTADIERDGTSVSVLRRTLTKVGDRVPAALQNAYRSIANHRASGTDGTGVQYPYLEIYAVRATAAFDLGVNNPVVDRVIAELVEGRRSAPLRVELALGTGKWQASSETPFRLGSRRFSVILIKPDGDSYE